MNRGPAFSARRPCAQRRPWPARPSPLRCVPGRRQPGSVRAHTQVRPGRSRRARGGAPSASRGALQQGRPASVTPPRRRHAKKELCVLNILSRPPPNHSARRRRRPCPPLPFSPGCSPIGQLRWRHGPAAARNVRRRTIKAYW